MGACKRRLPPESSRKESLTARDSKHHYGTDALVGMVVARRRLMNLFLRILPHGSGFLSRGRSQGSFKPLDKNSTSRWV